MNKPKAVYLGGYHFSSQLLLCGASTTINQPGFINPGLTLTNLPESSLVDDFHHVKSLESHQGPFAPRNTQHFCSNFFRGLGQNQHGHLCALLPLLPGARWPASPHRWDLRVCNWSRRLALKEILDDNFLTRYREKNERRISYLRCSGHLSDPSWPEIVHNCRERNGVAQEKYQQCLAAWQPRPGWNRSTFLIFSESVGKGAYPNNTSTIQGQLRRDVKGSLPEWPLPPESFYITTSSLISAWELLILYDSVTS